MQNDLIMLPFGQLTFITTFDDDTVEFKGNASSLNTALDGINARYKALDKELQTVNASIAKANHGMREQELQTKALVLSMEKRFLAEQALATLTGKSVGRPPIQVAGHIYAAEQIARTAKDSAEWLEYLSAKGTNAYSRLSGAAVSAAATIAAAHRDIAKSSSAATSGYMSGRGYASAAASTMASGERIRAHRSTVEGWVIPDGGAEKIDKITESTKKATTASKDLHISWNSIVRLFGVQVAHRFAADLISGLREGVVQATDLSIKIAQIQTLSQDAIVPTREWAEGLRNVSGAFGFDILDTATASYEALSNQMGKGIDVLGFMEDASKLAIATTGKQMDAVNLLSSVMNSYNLETTTAAQISAALFKAQDLGRFVMADYGNTIGNVTALASQLGVSYQEVFASLALMTKAGIKHNEASTQLRGIMLKMIQPTEETVKLFKELGYATPEAAVKSLGLFGALDKIIHATNGSISELYQYINRIRGASGIAVFAGDLHEAHNTLKEITESTKEFSTAFQLVSDAAGQNLVVELQKLKQYFIVDIGQDAVETLATTAKYVDLVAVAVATLTALVPVLAGATVGLIVQFIKFSGVANAFLAANPYARAFAAIYLTAQVLSKYMNKYYTDQSAYYDKMFEEERQAIKFYREEAEARVAASTRITNAIEKQLNASAAKARQSILAAEKLYAGMTQKISDDFTLMTEEVGQAFAAQTAAIKKGITETENALKAIDDFKVSGPKDAKDFAFKFNLDNLKTAQEKIDFIAKRIKELQSESASAEPKRRTEIFGEVASLIEEQHKLQMGAIEARKEAEKALGDEAISTATKRRELVREIEKKELELGNIKKNEHGKTERLKLQSVNAELEDLRFTLSQFDEEAARKESQLQKDLADIGIVRDAQIDALRAIEQVRKDIEAQNAVDAAALDAKLIADQQKVAYAKLQEKELDLKEKTFTTLDSDLSKAISEGKTDELVTMLEQREEALLDYRKALLAVFPNIDTSALDKVESVAVDRVANAMQERVVADKEEASKKTLAKLQEDKNKVEREIARREGVVERSKFLNQSVTKDRQPLTNEQLLLQAKMVAATTDMFIDAFGLPKDFEEAKARVAELQKQYEATFKPTKTVDLAAEKQAIEALKGESLKLNQEIIKLAGDVGVKEAEMVAAVATTTQSIDEMLEEVRRQFALTAQFIMDTKSTLESGTVAIPPKALGGAIQSGRDTVAAMLTPGEFVVNAESSKRFYSQLLAINSNRYAGGGSVRNNTFGDINVTLNSSGKANIDAVAIGNALKREIRRGTLTL
jgi:TP901 family phage tail tape measure protein